MHILFPIFYLMSYSAQLAAQPRAVTPDIAAGQFTATNRAVTYDGGTAHLDARPGDGLLWLDGYDFSNGVIELDIRGRDLPGRSFVGVAFHGDRGGAYDAIYFRPFNFRDPERGGHAVQYVSMPAYDWSALRRDFPGTYENNVHPVPEPVDDWFHVRIVVDKPDVRVYVNGAEEPCLQVQQLSERGTGRVGFWVGNGSEGRFRNLILTKTD